MEILRFFYTSLRMSSVRVEPNVIDYIVCPSFSLTFYYQPVCAITDTKLMNDRGTYFCAKRVAVALSHKQPEIQSLRLDNNHGNLISMHTFVFV